MLSINQGGYKGLQVIVGGIFIPIDQCALYKYEMNERATSTVVGTLPCFAAFTAKNLPGLPRFTQHPANLLVDSFAFYL